MSVLFGGTSESLKDRVQLVRDVLAPILAIFGTVTGFYFGTQAKTDGDTATKASITANKGSDTPPAKGPDVPPAKGGDAPPAKKPG